MTSIEPILDAKYSLTDDEIKIDLKIFGKIIQTIISQPARIRGVSQAQIKFYRDEKGIVPTTLKSALEAGTKPLDAILGLISNTKDGIPYVSGSAQVAYESRKALFFLFIFIMLRGNHPTRNVNHVQPMPKFMVSTLGCTFTENELADRVASFDLIQLDPSWVRYVSIQDFNTVIKQRLSLGMPGFRLINVFGLLDVKPDASEEITNAVKWVKSNLVNRYYWDLFPTTRSDEVIQKLPTLNRSLSDLAAQAFREIDLADLKEKKVLFTLPKIDPRYSNWKTWPSLKLELNCPIFSDKKGYS